MVSSVRFVLMEKLSSVVFVTTREDLLFGMGRVRSFRRLCFQRLGASIWVETCKRMAQNTRDRWLRGGVQPSAFWRFPGKISNFREGVAGDGPRCLEVLGAFWFFRLGKRLSREAGK